MTTIGIKPEYDTAGFQVQKPSNPQNDAKRSNYGNTDLDLPSYGNRVQNAREKLPNFNAFDNSYENTGYRDKFGSTGKNAAKSFYPAADDFLEDFAGMDKN